MKINPGSNLLLKGVVGSQAFGLAHEGSDYDYQGIFVAPTQSFLGLEGKVQESFLYKDPDTTYHEVGKYCRLALKCNPTVLDLLWLDEYNVRTELGTELINLRNNFLSASYVRDAYFGYAVSQLGKLNKDPRPEKRAKNARHFVRLLIQGWQLYSTGTYSVKLADAENILWFGQQVGYDNDLKLAKTTLKEFEGLFNHNPSVLPERPNKEPIEAWLQKTRYEFYEYRYEDTSESMEEFKVWP
jgi:predicted nucleotidyltransferase